MTPFEWMVALRYLRSENKPFLLRMVTYLSIAGVAAGVGTLVIALAMNNGFRTAIRDRLLGVTAHVNIKPVSSEGVPDYRAVATRLASTPGVRSVAPALYETVLLSNGGQARGIVVKGVDPLLERSADSALQKISAGSRDFSPDSNGIPSILIGKILAEQLRVRESEYVTLTSPEGSLTPFGMIPRAKRFRVTGIFDSGFFDYDANWAFTTLQSAQDLAGLGDVAGLLEIRLDHLDDARTMAGVLLARAGTQFTATTWMDENRALFRALSLEKLVTAIFIGLITFVAGLNILVVLTMTVAERMRDIAILMSMGARHVQIRNIFILQGVVVGAIGTSIGLAFGYSLAAIADYWRIIPLDPEIYAIPYVPFHSNVRDALWIAAAALLISAAATLFPARSAAGTVPVEILRFE
jgi:lipoprotein-releasing system permease protein